MKYKNTIILINLVFLVLIMTRAVVKKEKTLVNGTLVLLELAPVDPRSLMQGDYMRLNYKISSVWRKKIKNKDKKLSKRGFCVVKLKENGVADVVRFQENKTKQNDTEYIIPYTASSRWNINIGAESFFFQEGEGEKYEKGKYGALRIDNDGNSILVGLYDKDLNEIK